MTDESKSKKRRVIRDINLMGVDYNERYYQQTLLEWRKFISGDPNIALSTIPQEVFDSWVRCVQFGVDPLGKPNNEMLTGEALETLLTKNKEFIDVSRPFMVNLYRFLEGSGFMVSLFDPRGFVLEMLGDPKEDKLVRPSRGFVGACWDMKNAGNNAVSAVITYEKPMQVFGAQHYKRIYHGATGSSSPIFDPAGDLLGGIVLFGRYYLANPHTLGMAVAAAGAIENELRMRKALAESGNPASKASTIVVYDKAPHAFNADYRPSYRKEEAEDGWKRLLAWFKQNGI